MLSEEEKDRIIEELKLQKAYAYKLNNPQIKMITGCALNLIEKQSKEIEELKKQDLSNSKIISNMSTRHFNDREKIRKYEELQDKIKAKIEELDKMKSNGEYTILFNSDNVMEVIKAVLQSLLEKE